MGRRAGGAASAEGTAPVRGAEGAGRAIVVVRMGRAWRYRPRRGSALVGGRFAPCCGGVLWSPAAGESLGVVAIPAGLPSTLSVQPWRGRCSP